ncbi:Ig-like domain-containing protein [Butyrivibrio sp. WCD3002]|uniref:Ig-like domain-containing protein n=1 Tax=Butyrivibrio sp. WCD3002 TaxID=1280676 RepID=UPI00041C942B|nr:Ig-like domain-containing protein [Butyrivibrio sp. WCD3002]
MKKVLKKILILALVLVPVILCKPGVIGYNRLDKVEASSLTGAELLTKEYTLKNSSQPYYKKLDLGKDLQLVLYSGKVQANPAKCKFTSSNKKVATIDKDGVIHSVKTGRTVINVKEKKTGRKLKIILSVADESTRTLFIGDSRSVDLFTAKPGTYEGYVKHDMVIYTADGAADSYAEKIFKYTDLSDYDTVVSWLGANNYGNFSPYKKIYNKFLSRGLNLILCTVGAVKPEYFPEGDEHYFGVNIIGHYNSCLKKWAKGKSRVSVIDLYKYTKNNVYIETRDGVHYLPKPTKVLWKYIVKKVFS